MKVSFLASHGGSAAKHVITAVRNNSLDVQIGIVITNNREAGIVKWCKENCVGVVHISGKTHPVEVEKDRAIHSALSAAKTDLIVLSGYMKQVGPITLAAYPNKILNIHPALLPKHGGRGFYGDRVHEAVLKSGDRLSGATVHFVNEAYDQGAILSQQTVDIVAGETVESLKSKVQAIEGELYLRTIKQLTHNDGVAGVQSD